MGRFLELLGLAAVLRLVIGSGGRLSLWWDIPSGVSVDRLEAYLDGLERAHIRELSITVQDHGPSSWHLNWSLARLEHFIKGARRRGIRCGVMVWPRPDPSWVDALVTQGPALVRAGAQFVEFDVEENWRTGRLRGYRSLEEAAEELEESHGLSVELIDVRFINPLNYDTIVASVAKTGKVVLVSDACERGSFLHTMASQLSQLAFDELDGPVVVVGSRNWITPAAELEDLFFPQKEWILDAIHERLLPLAGHTVSTNQSAGELARRCRRGI